MASLWYLISDVFLLDALPKETITGTTKICKIWGLNIPTLQPAAIDRWGKAYINSWISELHWCPKKWYHQEWSFGGANSMTSCGFWGSGISMSHPSKNHQKLEGQYLVFAARFAAMTTFRPWEIYPATSLDSKVAKCQVMVTDRLFFVMRCQNRPKPSHFTFHFYPSAIEHGLMEQLPFSSMIFPIFPINYPPCSY